MTYPFMEREISLQVKSLLKKHSIAAQSTEINLLSKIIKNSIEFNQKLYSLDRLNGISLATTVEDLIEIFMLRSEVYKEMNYDSEFPEIIKGLNFDEYDEHSAIIYSKKKTITGTSRLIFDSSDKKLPIDEKFSLDYLRNSGRNLAEASRVIIRNTKGLKQEFKLMTTDAYRILDSYQMDAVSVMTEEHLKLYKNFGGIAVEKSFKGYVKSDIDKIFLITLWRTTKISPFFKKVFLRNIA